PVRRVLRVLRSLRAECAGRFRRALHPCQLTPGGGRRCLSTRRPCGRGSSLHLLAIRGCIRPVTAPPFSHLRPGSLTAMHRSALVRLGSLGLMLSLATAVPADARAAALPGLADQWFVTSDSVRLHYLSGGSGPTIVFVPGWTMPAEIWEPQLRYFVRSHRVIALDPRSQGASDRVSEGNFVDVAPRMFASSCATSGHNPWSWSAGPSVWWRCCGWSSASAPRTLPASSSWTA